MTYLKLVLTYLPMIIEIITVLEKNFKTATGYQKKEFVINTLANLSIAEIDMHDISKIVDIAVGAANMSGLFSHNPMNPMNPVGEEAISKTASVNPPQRRR